MAAECEKNKGLGPRIRKAGLVDLEVSFRDPAEDPKKNIAMVTLNGSMIVVRLPRERPVAEVAPAGLAGTQLNNRVR
jgi:hypothetical protein